MSHALARLAVGGLLSGHGDEWRLHGSVGQHLATTVTAPMERVEALVLSLARPRGSGAR